MNPYFAAQDVSVRLATEADATALAPLLATLGYPTTASLVAGRLARLAAFGGSAVALVAALDGDVVGLVTAHAFPSVHAEAPAAWLTTLVVEPTARGRGIGRRLVHAAEAWAATQGAVRVSVTSGTHRTEAHRFYEGLGYALTGQRFSRPIGEGAAAAFAPGTGAA